MSKGPGHCRKRQPAPDPADNFRIYGTITIYDTSELSQGIPEAKIFSLSAPEMVIGPVGGRYLVKFTAPAEASEVPS